jgi:DNA-binding transcriptional ArsR family regulator
MSHYMTALAMKQKGLKPAAKIVLYWIADHHNETTGDCFPSIARLAQLADMSRRSVENQIAKLEAAGLVDRVKRHRETGGKTSNGYILRLTETDAQNLRMGSAKSAHGDAQNLRMNNLVNNNPVKEQSSTTPSDLLCEVVRHETATDFAAHRKAMKKPLTPEAARRIVSRLRTHPDPDAVLDLSIENGWQGIFPEKIGANNGQHHHAASNRPENRPDPALEQIARLAGLNQASGNGGR